MFRFPIRRRFPVTGALLAVWLTLGAVRAENRHPIVLVHGFMGWGPGEMAGFSYWGGFEDLQEYLRAQGFEVYTVSVGPVSSNWERAVEMYYNLKGGQVDYGQAHADRFGIIRKPAGKVFLGFYPDWDARHPIHIIGHSMGGQTARMLQYLLSNVIYEDSGTAIPEQSSLLGEAHQGWIASITTISTPHDGSTLSNIVTKSIPFLQDVIALAAVVGTDFYDFDLQQWGFERNPDESWSNYFRRMREHPAWGTRNISAWDVSLDGARALNTLLTAAPDVYYFSYATTRTIRDTATGFQVPAPGMSLVLHGNARLMGSRIAYWKEGTSTDSTWFENDGVVNTVSMRGPTSGMNGPDPIAEYNSAEPLLPGQWYFRGRLPFDHKQIIGHGNLSPEAMDSVKQLYRRHCRLLWSLPE